MDETYDQLRCITSKTCRSNKKIIVGGDFNTQFGIGIRGVSLDQFAKEFGLNVLNASSPETNADWTFRSNMGVCRRLDFIIASQNLLVSASGPSDKLDLGSDHRVVETTMVCQKRGTQKYYERKIPVKGWRPEVDTDGDATKYWDALEKGLHENELN